MATPLLIFQLLNSLLNSEEKEKKKILTVMQIKSLSLWAKIILVVFPHVAEIKISTDPVSMLFLPT